MPSKPEEQLNEELRMTCLSYGFPDCGHLFSSDQKEAKNRIKCIQAMLNQRKLDIDFRNKMKEDGKT